MARTDTTAKTSFTRGSEVIYGLPSPAYSSPVVTITVPPKSSWTSGLHFHKTHTEYLSVLKGTALLTHNGITKPFTYADGVATIYPYEKHEWRRAEVDGSELVVKEWTDPEDGQKEVFFRNLSSVIADGARNGAGWLLTLQLFLIFWSMDNWPVFFDCSRIPILGAGIEWIVTHLVLGLAVLAGGAMGLQSEYAEYTPRQIGKKSGVGKGKDKEG